MKQKSVLIILAFLFFGILTQAQVTFQVGAGGGYAIASGDFGKEMTTMDSDGYGMKGGINLHAKARVGLLSFIGVGEVGYTMFSADGTIGSIKYDNTMNVFSLKVGPEFHLGLPLIPIDPYFGANFQVNSFSGDTKLQGVSGLASGTYDMEGATRYGIGINGGVIFGIGGMKIDLNASYNMLNAFGKSFEDNPSATKWYLDDGEGGGSDSKSINTIEIKATVMFGI